MLDYSCAAVISEGSQRKIGMSYLLGDTAAKAEANEAFEKYSGNGEDAFIVALASSFGAANDKGKAVASNVIKMLRASSNSFGEDLRKCRDVVCESLLEASGNINAESKRLDDAHLGCSVATALIKNNNIVFTNLGDCCIYHIHNGTICKITDEHSERVEENGCIVKRLNRYLGIGSTDDAVKIPIYNKLKVNCGDVLLFCNAGISENISEEKMCEIMMKSHSANERAGMLIQNAKAIDPEVDAAVIVIDVGSEKTRLGTFKHFNFPKLNESPIFALGLAVIFLLAAVAAIVLEDSEGTGSTEISTTPVPTVNSDITPVPTFNPLGTPVGIVSTDSPEPSSFSPEPSGTPVTSTPVNTSLPTAVATMVPSETGTPAVINTPTIIPSPTPTPDLTEEPTSIPTEEPMPTSTPEWVQPPETDEPKPTEEPTVTPEL